MVLSVASGHDWESRLKAHYPPRESEWLRPAYDPRWGLVHSSRILIFLPRKSSTNQVLDSVFQRSIWVTTLFRSLLESNLVFFFSMMPLWVKQYSSSVVNPCSKPLPLFGDETLGKEYAHIICNLFRMTGLFPPEPIKLLHKIHDLDIILK